MKEILLGLVCVFCSTASIDAQKKVGSYTNSYFEKEYDINASNKDGSYSIYIEVATESKNTTAMLQFDENKLESARVSLMLIMNKFEEWSKVAKNNDIDKMTKAMNYSLDDATVCWLGSKWHFAFNQSITPKFIVFDKNRHVVSFVKKVASSSNEYIDETIYWIFSSPEEIKTMIGLLDIKKIKEKFEEEDKTNKLFR